MHQGTVLPWQSSAVTYWIKYKADEARSTLDPNFSWHFAGLG